MQGKLKDPEIRKMFSHIRLCKRDLARGQLKVRVIGVDSGEVGGLKIRL